MRYLIISFFTILLIGVNVSCAQDLVWPQVLKDIRSRYPDVNHISTTRLAEQLATTNSTKLVLLDVREEDEFSISHLPGAIRIDPDLTDLSPLAHLDPNTRIVAYCSVGYRSSALAEKLQSEGFSDVSNLEGSIFQWANAGHPVVRGDSTVRAVHPYNTAWGQLLNAELRKYKP